jgi:hypothetical protein
MTDDPSRTPTGHDDTPTTDADRVVDELPDGWAEDEWAEALALAERGA